METSAKSKKSAQDPLTAKENHEFQLTPLNPVGDKKPIVDPILDDDMEDTLLGVKSAN